MRAWLARSKCFARAGAFSGAAADSRVFRTASTCSGRVLGQGDLRFAIYDFLRQREPRRRGASRFGRARGGRGIGSRGGASGSGRAFPPRRARGSG
jgi:hypothetical protein